MIFKLVQKLSHTCTRYLVNDGPAQIINSSYDAYSRLYRGQISLGLPVSKELITSQAEIRSQAVRKLALVLYHICLNATTVKITRDAIGKIIHDELKTGRIRLTENVILLTIEQITHLALQRFKIPRNDLDSILETAGRRRILSEALRVDPIPSYFESDIEEKAQNGRGDYETVYYRSFTDEGKEIGFRRLVSMEGVTAGDKRPAVVLVPGFANNSNCFNINNRYSLAKDMADDGAWVYLFDPRGVGVNQGRFDPLYTVDTMIDYDLATLIRFIYARSAGKPSVLVGHSMGGLVAENMLLNWSLAQRLNDLEGLAPAQKDLLAQVLPPPQAAARYQKMVKGIVSLASPKFFSKKDHVFFPTSLWLNHLTRIFRLKNVPVKEISKVLTELPLLKQMTRFVANRNLGDLNFLISPNNHKKDKYFVERYLRVAMESIPLGLGFQCLKAVYNGQGFKRMDGSRLNYSDWLHMFPEEIPVFHFWGARDKLVPLDNLRYRTQYPHRVKKIFHISSPRDMKHISITSEKSQLIDFVVEGANHLDLLYGKAADDIVKPLLMQIIENVWGDWSYHPECGTSQARG
ncbi:MAG: alpha/beta fold hydrolase [Desulfosarcinaceae bacterium]|nr:alpha/beta fold hydrolase [Desulfosarcinaceae bacterium]